MFSFSSSQPKVWHITKEDENDDENQDYCDGSHYCEYIYPVCPRGKISNKYWHLHQGVHWTAHEFDVKRDMDKFSQAPLEYQEAIMESAAVLMYGDSMVLEFLGLEGVDGLVKCMSRKAMFQDQAAREMVHSDFYSKMLILHKNGDKLRTEAEKNRILKPLLDTLQDMKVDKNNLSEVLFIISLCEYVLFAPIFVFINYISTLDYCPVLCDGNLLVMRDEYIHYCHACELQTILPNKIPREKALFWTAMFGESVQALVKTLYGKKGLESVFPMIAEHCYYILHMFKKDNFLYQNKDDADLGEASFGTTPAQKYMQMAEYEIKVNMMEVDSTIYGTSSAVDVDGMNFS
jgi:hypothetical protein